MKRLIQCCAFTSGRCTSRACQHAVPHISVGPACHSPLGSCVCLGNFVQGDTACKPVNPIVQARLSVRGSDASLREIERRLRKLQRERDRLQEKARKARDRLCALESKRDVERASRR